MPDVRRLPGPGAPDADGYPVPLDGTLAVGLLDGLLSGVVPEPPAPLDAVARSVEAHREHARAWYGDLIGPLGVPAAAAAQLTDALRSSDHGMPVVLIGPGPDVPDELMRAARAQLLDDDRVELAGVEQAMVAGPAPRAAAERTLAALDVSGTAWLRVPADPDWIEALDVVADDGAERIALVLPATLGTSAHNRVAAMIQSLVSRNLPFCLVPEPGAAPVDLVTGDAAYGLLNLLCATGTAIEGHQGRLAEQLGQTDSAIIIEDARRITPQSAAAIRSLVDRVSCGSVRALIGDLETAGLIVPDVA